MPQAPFSAHIATASINQTVGDWVGNASRIRGAIDEARQRGARLLILPEMCVSGYSLGDRLLMSGTLRRSWQVLEELLPHTHGMVVVVGLPIQHRDVIYNAAAVIADGRVWGLVPKENLATGDVQYENRWFSGWPRVRVEDFETPSGELLPIGGLVFDAPGVGRFAIEICEDGWKGIRPGSVYALAGAHIIANPSASWFVLGKHRTRRAMVEQISREDHCVYVYTSLLGCDATRLVFDGSVFVAQDGAILEEADRFVFHQDFVVADRVVDLAGLARVRMEEGSWRQQAEALQRGDYGPMPRVVTIAGDYTTDKAPPAVRPYWIPADPPEPDPSLSWLFRRGLVPQAISPQDLSHLELELALAMGLREYVKKCGIRGFALALSGGRDSSMVAILVARAYRYDQPDLSEADWKAYVSQRFVTAYMGTENSGTTTRNAARALAAQLGARHYESNIQPALDTHLAVFKDLSGVGLSWSDPAHDIPLQNVQARLRGGLIWTLANIHNFLLLTTSNKSEAAVGYCTMDGDTAGGLSPITDVPKSLVMAWVDWATRFHGLQSLDLVTQVPATAELRPPDRKQTDEDDLMPFPILDQLMYHVVQLGQEPVDVFRTLWPSLGAHYGGDPKAFGIHIRKFFRMLCQAQWKRERFAISFRVTAFDLDPKTGFRFPPVQAPFTVELAELDAYIARL